MSGVPVIALVAPVFLVWEFVHLALSERYMGKNAIRRGTDPRLEGPPARLAAAWTLALILYWLWMGMMLTSPFGRVNVIVMLGTSLLAYTLRRNVGLKWILVVLTFEGAIRVGMLIALIGRIWNTLH